MAIAHRFGPVLNSSFGTGGGGGGGGGGSGSSPNLGGAGGGGGGSGGGEGEMKPKIQHTVATNLGVKKSEWRRKPNVTGAGATHVRTFHARLNSEAIEILDQQVNAWLDEHPEIEVKQVAMTVGEWQGKVKEPNLIVQVWV